MKCSLFFSIVLSLISFTSHSQDKAFDLSDVGEVYLENSGSVEAQQAFLHGLAQLHSFEYKAAREDFIAAQKIDPNFALAYWGEAMTYDHPIWHFARPDVSKALDALNRFAPSPAERQKKAALVLERDLLAAADILFGEGDEYIKDFYYQEKMASLYKKYPENVEVASFYALATLGTAHKGRDFAVYMQSAALMGSFFDKYPRHPGVAHYLIHSVDDSIHAPLGLRAANAYVSIAPNAPHAQHMATHIYLALGMWEQVIRGGIRATNLSKVRGEPQGQPCGHYPSWLMYGHLQLGQFDQATTLMKLCYDDAIKVKSDSRRVLSQYVWMQSLYLQDTGYWQGAVSDMKIDTSASKPASFNQKYLSSLIALKRGDVAKSKALYEQASEARQGLLYNSRITPDVQLLQLKAQIFLFEGFADEAVKTLKEAVDLEMSLPLIYGPPVPSKPSLELLGETLIELTRLDEARKLLTQQLRRTKGRALTVKSLGEIGGMHAAVN